MPTASKVVAALIFAFIAWFASYLVIPYLPPNIRLGWLHEVCAAIGALMGWTMSGRRAGQGVRAAVSYGLTSVGLTVFWALLVSSAQEMIDRSLNLRYHGPVEALGDMMNLYADYAVLMAKPDVVIWLLVGAVFGGIVTELSSREWS